MGTIILRKTNKEKVEKLKAQLETKDARKAYRKLYKIFLDELDDVSRSQVKRLDQVISKFSSVVMFNGGWAVGRRDAINHESKKVTDDYMTYRIVRDLHGFHQQQEVPRRPKVNESREAEKRFLKERRVELTMLHQTMLLKDDFIYNRRYKLKDPSRAEFVEELRELLGYNNPEYTILPPELKGEIIDISSYRK